jgi:hypothetical protein
LVFTHLKGVTVKLKSLALFVLFAALSACAPNPIDVATGEQIKIQAASAALDAEQARVFAEQNQAAKLANDEAAAAKFQAMIKTLYQVGAIFGGIALAVALVGAGAGIGYAAVGTGQAISIATKFKATLVYLDPATGTYPQYPMLVSESPTGKVWALVDPNTHSSILLNVNNIPDKQSIINAGYIAAIGIQTRNGRLTVHQGDVLPVDQPNIPVLDRLIVQNESRT